MKLIAPSQPTKFPGADLYLGIQVPNTCFDAASHQQLGIKTFRFYGVVFDVVPVNATTAAKQTDQLLSDMIADVLGDA